MSISDRPLGVSGAEESPLALGEARRALAGPDAAHAHIWTRRDALTAFGAIALFMALAAGLWIANGAVVPWDSKNHFYPMFRFLGEALRHGEVPLWNPYHFAGHPSVADPQSLIFTPTFFLFALLRPAATMQEFDLLVLAHLLMGGAGVLALCARRGFIPCAAVLAGLIFMLGGVAASRLQHTGMIISYSFFPLALLTLEIMLERPRLLYGVGFGILASLMALGRDQVAYLFCLVLIARVLYAAAVSRRPLDYLLGRWPALLAAAATGAAILIAPVLLTLQFLATSNRPGIAFGVAAAGSLAPVNLVTLLAPDIFGSLDKSYEYWGPGYDTMAAPDWTDRAIDYLFIGAAPVVLGFWHGLAGGRIFAKEMRFVHYMLAAALIYTLGRWTPLFAPIYDFFPGVSLYRRPADAAFCSTPASRSAPPICYIAMSPTARRGPFRKCRRARPWPRRRGGGRHARARDRRARLLLRAWARQGGARCRGGGAGDGGRGGGHARHRRSVRQARDRRHSARRRDRGRALVAQRRRSAERRAGDALLDPQRGLAAGTRRDSGAAQGHRRARRQRRAPARRDSPACRAAGRTPP